MEQRGLHQISGRLSNIFLYKKKKDLLIFDTGFGDEKYVMAYIKKYLPADCRIKLVAVTHRDIDHSGGVAALAKETLAKSAISDYARKSTFFDFNVEDVFTRTTTGIQEIMKPRFWRMYKKAEDTKKRKALPEVSMKNQSSWKDFFHNHYDIFLKDGDSLPGFEEWIVLATPGHSADSSCFFHTKHKFLITGDTILGSASTNTLVLPAVYENRNRLLNSIEKLADLKPEIFCPGHGVLLQGKSMLNKLLLDEKSNQKEVAALKI